MSDGAPYPGHLATPATLVALAAEYRRAAHQLIGGGPRGEVIAWAPARLLALQSIELYLNALLLARGHGPAAVRGLQHDLEQRAARAARAGLVLRRRTAQHLVSLNAGLEYLVIRYAPDLVGSCTHVTRLTATLDEIANKVAKLLAPASPTMSRPVPGPAAEQVSASSLRVQPGFGVPDAADDPRRSELDGRSALP